MDSSIPIKLTTLFATYNQKVGVRDKYLSDFKINQAAIDKLEQDIQIDTMGRTVLDVLSRLNENYVKEYLEPLITEAIHLVFGYDIKFGIAFGFDHNQVTVSFSLTDVHGNVAEGAIEDLKGGGILDVISIVLRFVFLELFQLPGAIILDEPGKFVDTAHQGNLGNLINSFSQKFNRQIIIVTHDQGICSAGTKHYHVTQDDNGVSHAIEIDDFNS